MWFRALTLATVFLLTTPVAQARLSEPEIVHQSSIVLNQILSAPAQGIPRQLLADAQAVVIVPQLKGGAFVVGIRKGRGVVIVREANGTWRAPQFVEMSGGSIGWQAGVQSSDVILVFRSRESLNNLMSGKLTIGADASVAAGPVGRQVAAATDLDLSAEVYSYSRSRGAFVGVAIDGTVLKSDPHADSLYYPSTGEIPRQATDLIAQLAAYVGGPPPATQTALVLPEPPQPQSDPLRQQLADSSRQLSAILDPQWNSFLALPDAIYREGAFQSQEVAQLRDALSRFEFVATTPEYAALSNRPEFRTVLVSLQQVVNEPPQEQLVLPPPPRISR